MIDVRNYAHSLMQAVMYEGVTEWIYSCYKNARNIAYTTVTVYFVCTDDQDEVNIKGFYENLKSH